VYAEAYNQKLKQYQNAALTRMTQNVIHAGKGVVQQGEKLIDKVSEE